MTSSKLEEDAALGARIGAKFYEWHEQWRVCEESVPGQYKPWEDLELSKPEEALPPLIVKALRRSAMASKATTGARVDGFHSNVSLDLSDECCGKIHTLLHEIQMAGVWPIDADRRRYHAFFVSIPNSTTSEQAIALLPTLIRWLEWLRGSTIFEWKSLCCHDWDACSKLVGRADRACCDSFLAVETFDLTAGKISILAQRRLPLWLTWPKLLRENSSAWCGFGLGTSVFRRECCVCSVVALCMLGAFCSKTDPSGRCFCWGLSCMMQWPKCPS